MTLFLFVNNHKHVADDAKFWYLYLANLTQCEIVLIEITHINGSMNFIIINL
jgi:hypothetical protein